MIFTPDIIDKLLPNEIFVFGSNYAGRHGKGAALAARLKFGAKNGQGTGLMGQSYGIATKDAKIRTLPLTAIETQVQKFLVFAKVNNHLRFLVTPIGCGLAGYSPADIAPFFADATGNVILPQSFVKILCKI